MSGCRGTSVGAVLCGDCPHLVLGAENGGLLMMAEPQAPFQPRHRTSLKNLCMISSVQYVSLVPPTQTDRIHPIISRSPQHNSSNTSTQAKPSSIWSALSTYLPHGRALPARSVSGSRARRWPRLDASIAVLDQKRALPRHLVDTLQPWPRFNVARKEKPIIKL